jgi:transposase
MKDGRTHLAHKAEHAVDLETGAIVGVTVQDSDDGDTETSIETLIEAAEQVETVRPDGAGIKEVVGDKGYHSNQSLVDLEAVGVRNYISEPDRGRRNWKKNPEARDAVYRNRRRIRGARGGVCCGSGGSGWNGPSPICMRLAACAACTCAAIPTFGSGC